MTPLPSGDREEPKRIRPEKPLIKGGIFPPNYSNTVRQSFGIEDALRRHTSCWLVSACTSSFAVRRIRA